MLAPSLGRYLRSASTVASVAPESTGKSHQAVTELDGTKSRDIFTILNLGRVRWVKDLPLCLLSNRFSLPPPFPRSTSYLSFLSFLYKLNATVVCSQGIFGGSALKCGCVFDDSHVDSLPLEWLVIHVLQTKLPAANFLAVRGNADKKSATAATEPDEKADSLPAKYFVEVQVYAERKSGVF